MMPVIWRIAKKCLYRRYLQRGLEVPQKTGGICAGFCVWKRGFRRRKHPQIYPQGREGG